MFGRRDTSSTDETPMAKDKQNGSAVAEGAISIVGPGMRVVGNLETDGTVRIEGAVEGSVQAGKAVVVGKDGVVDGDVRTQDAVIAGRVVGTVVAESRLELQATSRIEGEVFARKLQLEEGAVLNGSVQMGDGAPAMAVGDGAPLRDHSAPPLLSAREAPN